MDGRVDEKVTLIDRPLKFKGTSLKKRETNIIDFEERAKLKNTYVELLKDANMGGEIMDNKYLTEKDLKNLEEKIDLKIKVAIQPIEGKIDNLPTQFENLLLKERQHQDDKTKETRRYIWGTIGIGLLSIFVSVALNFI